MGIQNDFDCEDNPNLTEKEEPKKRKRDRFKFCVNVKN